MKNKEIDITRGEGNKSVPYFVLDQEGSAGVVHNMLLFWPSQSVRIADGLGWPRGLWSLT